MPDLINKFIEGGTIGISHNPGLPNIEGYGPDSTGNDIGVSGCYENTTSAPYTWRGYWGGGNNGTNTTKFDASISNTIYGNSTTVQPASLEMTYCIKF